MPKNRQVILLHPPNSTLGGGSAVRGGGGNGGEGAEPVPLGTLREVLVALAPFNTAPDGSGKQGWGEMPGIAVLHGPGMVVEVPTAVDDIVQIMVTITDEDFAWPILAALCRQEKWGMMDPDSGRVFASV